MINIKRRLKILTLKFKRMILLNLSEQPDKNYLRIQKKAEQIINNLIDNPNSDIYILNDIFYIKNENILVRFDDTNAHVTNGSYSYYISIGQTVSRKLKSKYKSKVLEIVSNFDSNNDLNTINNLDKILKSI